MNVWGAFFQNECMRDMPHTLRMISTLGCLYPMPPQSDKRSTKENRAHSHKTPDSTALDPRHVAQCPSLRDQGVLPILILPSLANLSNGDCQPIFVQAPGGGPKCHSPHP